jgi:NADP-dependent 3-hydroxy acid dehydrogenase YdfG
MRTQDINEMFAVNVSGAIECCRRVIPIMKEQRSGCIVNVAALAGTLGVPYMAAYAASKWALRGLGLSLARELKADNIHVHNVCPGRVDTDFYEDLSEDDPVRMENPELRLKPDDVAQAVVYLATLSERCQVDELIVGARKLE